MIDGSKTGPKGADKMLALMKKEQDLETPTHSTNAALYKIEADK